MISSTSMVSIPRPRMVAPVATVMYRNDAPGWLAIAPAMILLRTAGPVSPRNSANPFSSPIDWSTSALPLPAVTVINLACCAAPLAMAWPAIRQSPPRSRWIAPFLTT